MYYNVYSVVVYLCRVSNKAWVLKLWSSDDDVIKR